MPQNEAGMRIEPPASVPTASGQIPAATATALPPLLPPGVRSRSHGLRVTPVSGESVTPFQPNSGVVVLPKNTAPAHRRRAVAGESSSHACFGSIVREPNRRGQPLVSTVSLSATGTPSSRPCGSPFCQRASEARAIASARLGVIEHKGIDCALVHFEPAQCLGCDLDRRDPLCPVQLDQPGCRCKRKILEHSRLLRSW